MCKGIGTYIVQCHERGEIRAVSNHQTRYCLYAGRCHCKCTNPKPIIDYGCDADIHQKAGPNLMKARKAIGEIATGDVAMTPGYDLKAKYVIHAVDPAWQGGEHGELAFLRQCYDKALHLAWKDLISRAGYALSHSSKFDIIVEYFIKTHHYNVFELNEVLFYYDQPLIGG